MKITKQITAFIIALAIMLPVAGVLAQKPTLTANTLGVGALDESLALSGGEGSDLRQTIANIINVALGFLGIIAVVIVLVGGFKYMIAGGDEGKTKEARGWIISGIIGLAIILSGWAITSFVIGQLIEATQ
ncbi:MAG: pilin [Patescibacteria group bacterium]|nr:pilin [Patescibacteria group bacterium]